MKTRKLLCISLSLLLSLCLFSCESDSDSSSSYYQYLDSSGGDDDDDDDTSSWELTDYTVSDLVEANVFDYTIDIDFSANTAHLSAEAAETITESGVTLLTVGDEVVEIYENSYGITVESTVDAKIKYVLTGSLAGTFTVESETAYQLNLDACTITGTAGPALNLESAQKVFIVTASGTTNTVMDTASRSEDLTQKSAIYGKGPMIFSGEGTLAVTGKYKDGIANTDYIYIRSGTMTVSTNVKDAIHTVNKFLMDDGSLTISATGSTTGDESMGIKVVGDDNTTNGAGKGYVVIDGGTLSITSRSKGITAHWDSTEDQGDNTSGNPNPYVEINDGTITITTNGSQNNNVPEGIEGKSSVTINGGSVTINAVEDGINGGNSVRITGGEVYVKSTGNDTDGIDSNGSLTITGGTVVGIGGVVAQPTSNACTQHVVVLGSQSSGSTVGVAAGTCVFAYRLPQAGSTMLLSTDGIANGTKYYIYAGGTAAATSTFHNLYLGTITYSGGSTSSNFTASASSYVTKLGGTYF